MKIALVEFAPAHGEDRLRWEHGPHARVELEAERMDRGDAAGPLAAGPLAAGPLAEAVERVLEAEPDWVLTWDPRLGEPAVSTLLELARAPGDVFHAGLRLGQGGRPRLLETVHPTWMLAADPSPEIEATSWRLSLRAAFFRPRVWRQLGGPDLGYASLDGASLELGHRWLWGGALLRHAPRLLPAEAEQEASSLLRDERQGERQGELQGERRDEFRFLFQRVGRFWATWALGRALVSRRVPPSAVGDWWRSRHVARREESHLPGPPALETGNENDEATGVTVLIPTLDRYPYLRVVLEQLARQSVRPVQVIVIDQTEPARRRRDWHDQPGLPLLVIERQRPGQSSARNAGLRQATGEVILFLDDDVEMDEDLIARHLEILRRTGADACCGVTEEAGAGPLPAEFRHPRLSDVFPTCNASLRRRALRGSGLFDLAFDHGARADADFGRRLYLSGALLLLSPSVSVFHHKAPAGGLRRHKARVATYAASRRSLVRHLPSVTEIYLARRSAGASGTREMLWQRIFGTLRARGGGREKLLKLGWGLLLFPDTLVRVAWRLRLARRMLRDYPQIPAYPEERGRDA